MSPETPSRTPAESRSLQERTDRVCDEFEARLRAGSQPRIEDFLGTATGDEGDSLLRELLRVEVEYRWKQGASPQPQDYTARFPGREAVIRSVLTAVPTLDQRGAIQGMGTTVPSPPGYELRGELGRGGM